MFQGTGVFLLLTLSPMQTGNSGQLPMVGVTGRPFEAKYEWVYSKKLPDGRVSTSSEVGALYRDSKGRERKEEHQQSENGKRLKITAEIYDPPGKTVCFLDIEASTILLEDKLAVGFDSPVHWTLTINIEDEWAIAISRGKVPDTGEKLGQKFIEGFLCEGYSITESGRYAVECWVSEELHETLLISVVSGPKESTFRLFDIRRVEPDRTLFIVPSDYRYAIR